MPISHFPHGFLNGVTIRGVPVQQLHPGRVFWVNGSSVPGEGAVAGSDSGVGNYTHPFATIDYAVGRCTANRGDIIAVMPGHVETIIAANTLDLDVAGIAVIGLGHGALQPRCDYTIAAGEVAIAADNITVSNVNFHASAPDVLIGIDIEDGVDYATINNCLFDVETTGTDEFATCISLLNNNTGCVISNNYIEMGLGNATEAILLDADTHRTQILDNVITGDYSTANIFGDTALSTELLVSGNLLVNGGSGGVGTEPVLELLTGTTGVISKNVGFCNVATVAAAWVGDKVFHNETWTGETAGVGETTERFSATHVAHADG